MIEDLVKESGVLKGNFSMVSEPQASKLAGDIPVDIFQALKKAIIKIRSTNMRIKAQEDSLDRALTKLSKLTTIQKRVRAPSILHSKIYDNYISRSAYETASNKARRIKRELLDSGMTVYGLLKSESRIIPKVLHPDEHIKAVVYGQHHASSVMLVATDERILFIDKKPMAAFLDEITYEVVSGIQFEIHTFFATLILHTPIKNYDIRYANLHCAENFARHIELQRLKREKAEEEKLQVSENLPITVQSPKKQQPIELKQNLAGYYWLPQEEEESEI